MDGAQSPSGWGLINYLNIKNIKYIVSESVSGGLWWFVV